MPTTVTKTDINNEFDWTTIKTTTDDNGVVTRVWTTYDNKVEVIDYYKDGVLSSQKTYDSIRTAPGGEFDFKYRSLSFDKDGNVKGSYVEHDDGYNYSKRFLSDGTLKYDQIVDASNLQPWEKKSVFYNDDGTVSSRSQDWDNGYQKYIAYYASGKIKSMNLHDESDDGSLHSWKNINTSHDENGLLIAYRTTYDTGERKYEAFKNGVRSFTTLDDKEDARDYETKFWSYDSAGQLASFHVDFDSGLKKSVFYKDGKTDVIVYRDKKEAAEYKEKRLDFDANGKISERLTTYDNGEKMTEKWNDGVRTLVVVEDLEDAKSYEKKSISYDEAGRMSFRYTAFDTGETKREYWENGIRTETRVNDDNNATDDYHYKKWFHDADGKLTHHIIHHDNDIRITFQYRSDGVLKKKTVVDSQDAESFAFKVYLYDSEGDLEYRAIKFDNGMEQQNRYDDHVLVEQYLKDTGDIEEWDTVTEKYESGVLVKRTTVMDDGTTEVETFSSAADEFIF